MPLLKYCSSKCSALVGFTYKGSFIPRPSYTIIQCQYIIALSDTSLFTMLYFQCFIPVPILVFIQSDASEEGHMCLFC